MITIPAGTRPVPCKKAPACAVPVYWVKIPAARQPKRDDERKRGVAPENLSQPVLISHPVSASAEGCSAPSESADGIGVSHFSDCAFAHEFRKRKPSAE